MIFLRLEISYTLTFNDGCEHDELFVACFPEALANELLNNTVRKQMEFFINNLALLQGAERGKFNCAFATERKNSDYYCACDNAHDCEHCSVPGEFYDAHVCSDDTGYGCCSICGAIIHGSSADYELHSYDPPDTL